MTDAYDQVLEIMKWIHDNVEYVPGTTTSVTSAMIQSRRVRGPVAISLTSSSRFVDSRPIFHRLRASPQAALTEAELGENAISLDIDRNEPDKDRP